jgi:hypothetical protein
MIVLRLAGCESHALIYANISGTCQTAKRGFFNGRAARDRAGRIYD